MKLIKVFDYILSMINIFIFVKCICLKFIFIRLLQHRLVYGILYILHSFIDWGGQS